MTHIAASRDALVSFLHNEGDDGIWEHFDRGNAEIVADALIASGAILAADSLADDKALIADIAYVLAEGEATYAASTVRHVFRALAAALTERTR